MNSFLAILHLVAGSSATVTLLFFILNFPDILSSVVVSKVSLLRTREYWKNTLCFCNIGQLIVI